MAVEGRNLTSAMIEVRKEVVAATSGAQVPWDHSALTGEFFFAQATGKALQGAITTAPAGSPADVTALQERLTKLEREAKEREAQSAAGAVVQADGFKLAELRARAANVEDLTKELQKKLFAARMEEGRASDTTERSRLLKKSMDIQMEWTRRGQDLKRLRDEIAALEGKSNAAPAGPLKP